ncbi:MAG: hypothetical protein OER12_08695 [Acidimicrobiia bacterium]|nr:hypothetical protein [Acidimicrobiia bacterium]
MKRLVTAGLAVAILAAVPGVAVAQEAPARPTNEQEVTRADRGAQWVDALKSRALEAIEKRLVTIGELEAAINRSETVEADHAAQLLNELRASAAGLEALAGEIRAAEDLETLWALVPKIFEDYRIYAVVAPKVHLVLGADHAGSVADRIKNAAGSLGEALDSLDEAGFDVADGEKLLAEMERLIAAGAEQAGSIPGMVLGLTPADYPGSSETLRSAQSVLQSGTEDLRAAGQTAHEIVRFILSVLAGDSTE